MWSMLLLVTVLVPKGLVEAGYVYNAPNPSLGLLNNQPADKGLLYKIQPQPDKTPHDTHEEGKSISYSISYNDYAHIKNGNIQNSLANFDQFPPNYNNIYVHGSVDQSKSNVVFLPTHNEQIKGVNWKNDYRIYEDSTNNLNNYNTHSQLLSPPYIKSSINQLSAITTTALPPYNGFNNRNGAPQVNQSPAALSNGFSQVVQTSATFSNGYNQVRQASVPSNNAYNPAPQASAGWNPKQSVISSVTNNLNTGYKDSFLPRLNLQSSNDHTQSSSTSSGININDGYVQSSKSINVHSNNVAQNNLNTELSSVTANAFTNNIQRVHPIVHKHIYFHVPPPEIEGPQNLKLSSIIHKKNYKILFIKLPSDVSESNVAHIQQQIAQSAAVDVKTLIYVLVKRPEDPKPVVLSTPNQSHHQVFFVKYTGNPADEEAQTSDELDKPGLNRIASLTPELTNGLN